MRRTVLIGYDGTPHGADALDLGRDLAEALGAQLMVTTVVRHPHLGADKEKFEAAVDRHTAEVFAAARDRLDGAEIAERALVNGSRSEAIYALAEWEEPSLIVIGSTHRGPVNRTMLGSLGHSLMSGAPCGVAVAPKGYGGGEPGLDRIGVAVDGSSEGWRALKAAAVLAAAAAEPLRLLTVAPPAHYALGGLLSPYSPEEYRDFKQREAEDVLRMARERLDPAIEVEGTVMHGSPAEELAAAGEELDLLLLGSRAHGPITGVLLGSVSAKLISSAPCPVLVVARGAGAHPLED